MDLRKVKEKISKNEKFYVPKLNEIVTLREIKEEKGRKWGVGVTETGKDITIDIRFVEDDKEEKEQRPVKSFSDSQIENAKANKLAEEKRKALKEGRIFDEEKFLEEFDAKSFLEEKEKKTLEAVRFLGRKSKYIKRILRPEMANAMKKTMMTKVGHIEKTDATVRAKHYANTYLVAYNIAKGIFPGDEDLARGIAIMALGHDYGQCPFGHDGQAAAEKTLESYNAGFLEHGIQGALLYRFRRYNDFISAMTEEEIIEEEAKKVLQNEVLTKEEYYKKLEKTKHEIKEDVLCGRNIELSERIQKEKDENKELIDESIQLMMLAAGNHNGERGKPSIEPDYSRGFEEFVELLKETGYDREALNKLHPHNIADAIAKLSDQISSIPFDMIDGVRSGLVDEVPSAWVTPVAMILQISEEEAKERIKTRDNKELVTLAFEIQDKIINNVIENSSQRQIGMSLADWVYGVIKKTNDKGEVVAEPKIGLRTPNMDEYIIYTSTREEGILLENLFSDLTDRLSSEILNKENVFYPEINEVFRLKSNNPNRKNKEMDLKDKYDGNELLRDFYNYCVETTAEEYNYNKEIVKAKKIEYFRKRILEGIENREKDQGFTEPKAAKGTMEYAIEIALQSGIDKVLPNSKGTYTDEAVEEMMKNINAYLKNNPVFGVNKLQVVGKKIRQEIDGTEHREPRKITHDQAVAARMAASYLCTLNDEELIKLAEDLGVVKKEDTKAFKISYKEYSMKRNGDKPVETDASKRAKADYACVEGEEK